MYQQKKNEKQFGALLMKKKEKAIKNLEKNNSKKYKLRL